MDRRLSKTFTLALASVLTLLWCSESEARGWFRRRNYRAPATYRAPTYSAPACSSCSAGQGRSASSGQLERSRGCICPYMRYATFSDYEQWAARECPDGLLFTRDYPSPMYAGMCPNPPLWPNCSYPCQGARGPHASSQRYKRDEGYKPRLLHPRPFPGDEPREITISGENYWFDDPNIAGEQIYYVRIVRYELPRGWYHGGPGQIWQQVVEDEVLRSGYQIFEPDEEPDEVTEVESDGNNAFRLHVPDPTGETEDWVRVITIGRP